MNSLKIRKLLTIALFAVLSVFCVPSHGLLAQQKNLVVKQCGTINPEYAPPILVSSVVDSLKSYVENISAKITARFVDQNIRFKKQRNLHVSFFYLSKIPSQQQLNEMQEIVQEALIALKGQEIAFTVIPQLTLFGKAHNFVAIRLQPSQGAFAFFDHVRNGLVKAGIAYVQYPTFNAHMSLGKIITKGITQQQLTPILQEGTHYLKNIPSNQLRFTVSACVITQNLTKQPLVSFELQQSIKPQVTSSYVDKEKCSTTQFPVKIEEKSIPEVIPQSTVWQNMYEWLSSKLRSLKNYFIH